VRHAGYPPQVDGDLWRTPVTDAGIPSEKDNTWRYHPQGPRAMPYCAAAVWSWCNGRECDLLSQFVFRVTLRSCNTFSTLHGLLYIYIYIHITFLENQDEHPPSPSVSFWYLSCLYRAWHCRHLKIFLSKNVPKKPKNLSNFATIFWSKKLNENMEFI